MDTRSWNRTTNDLSADIDNHHRAFLTSEGTPKEESLILLRVHVIDFLCEVPHAQKFKFKETETVFSTSFETLPGFDPRKTSAAFENLAKYAHNLLEQPWRKDFHRIKITSGFWIHNIRTHLHNPQDMLSLLGYVATDSETLVLVRPPLPTTIVALSRDCYIASQECLIISQIWESLLRDFPNNPLTLKEVCRTRKLVVGDMSTVVSHLKHEIGGRELQTSSYWKENGLTQPIPNLSNTNAHLQPHSQYPFVPVGRLIEIQDTSEENYELERSQGSKGTHSSPPSGTPGRERPTNVVSPVLQGTVSQNQSPATDACASDELISELLQEYQPPSRLSGVEGQEVMKPQCSYSPQLSSPTSRLQLHENGIKPSNGTTQVKSPSPRGGLQDPEFINNFDIIGNGKYGNNNALTKSKIPNDFDMEQVDTRGSGIINKLWQNVPSIPHSIRKLEQFLGMEDRDSSSGGTPTSTSNSNYNLNGKNHDQKIVNNVTRSRSDSWDCPHCTFVNHSSNQGRKSICTMCCKSRDFVLPK